MGKQMIVIDDITGQPIEEGQGEHIRFSVNGTEYEIDLTDENAKEFHKTLGIYTERATKVGTQRQAPTAGSKKKRDPKYLQAVRDWARANGHEVSDRGRIAAEIEAAYEEANKDG